MIKTRRTDMIVQDGEFPQDPIPFAWSELAAIAAVLIVGALIMTVVSRRRQTTCGTDR
jgi:hypothetical protein